MKILLFGARGRLGQELLRTLAPLGETIASAREGDLPAGVSPANWRPADLCAPEEIRAVVAAARPDVIVNAAAYTAVEAAEREPQLARAVNAIAPGVLADAAVEIGAGLVHYSTDYVFDGRGDRPWREEDPVGPLNEYGRSKLAGEQAIRHSGAGHLILRTSWLYAVAGQSFAKKMLELATHEREITMVSDQIGAPTSVRFLAEATAQLLAQSAGDTSALFASRGGTLHVACAGETSWFAFAEEIFLQVKQLGLPLASPLLRSVRSDDRPGALPRPLNSRLDTTRLRDRFGVAPPFWDVEFRALFPSLFARYELEMREANNSAQASLR